MSHNERTGFRSLLYSGWHRVGHLRGLMGVVDAAKLTMVDIDSCEACCYCNEPVALIETQESSGLPKQATITSDLARLADIPAYSVSCEPTDDGRDIALFRVQQIAPEQSQVWPMNPTVYAFWLLGLRDGHACRKAA